MITWWVSILLMVIGGGMILVGAALGGFLVFKGAGRPEGFLEKKEGEVFAIPEPDFGFAEEPSEEEKAVLERGKLFEERFKEMKQ